MEDLKGLVEELEQEQRMSLINVELVDDELARVYSNSSNAQVSLAVCNNNNNNNNNNTVICMVRHIQLDLRRRYNTMLK